MLSSTLSQMWDRLNLLNGIYLPSGVVNPDVDGFLYVPLLQDLFNSMRNLHLILLQEYGIEAWCLFREWERLWLRTSDIL